MLRIPVVLLACSQDWTCHLQMIVSLEGRRTYRPKRCEYNNKDEDNSPKTLFVLVLQYCNQIPNISDFHSFYSHHCGCCIFILNFVVRFGVVKKLQHVSWSDFLFGILPFFICFFLSLSFSPLRPHLILFHSLCSYSLRLLFWQPTQNILVSS